MNLLQKNSDIRYEYSKPLGDVGKEQRERLRDEHSLYERQRALASLLRNAAPRQVCLLCGSSFAAAESFTHRSVPLYRCAVCKHIQTQVQPPEGYPHAVEGGVPFGAIYPRLSPEEYRARKERIYRPKLDWVVRVLTEELNYTREKLQQVRWVDMGCGAGYFLSALEDIGVEKAMGFDADKQLVAVGQQVLHTAQISQYNQSLSGAFARYPADVYTAFFVLEHADDAHAIYRALQQCPSGTVFVFSVPLYGLSALIENAFDHNYARNMDCVVHTQMYTEHSIAWAMQAAECDIVAQWVFGQDAEDFHRILLNNLAGKLSEVMIDETLNALSELLDPLQQCIDTLHLADQRHIVVRKW